MTIPLAFEAADALEYPLRLLAVGRTRQHEKHRFHAINPVHDAPKVSQEWSEASTEM